MKPYRRTLSRVVVILFFSTLGSLSAQTLTIQQALQTALTNYPTIKAKKLYLESSKANLEQTRRDYAPNLVLSAQQDYGTVNGQNGPLYGYGGYAVASSGLPLADQNWNAAFGALYLANFNWDFFTFGRMRERMKVAKMQMGQNESDLAQEQFQHQVRVIGAYLNLLAAQRLSNSQQRNLERAEAFRNVVVARSQSGLVAGVDSSQANAEVSNSRILLTRAIDFQQEQANRLAVLLGVTPSDFLLDSSFVKHIPSSLLGNNSSVSDQHPTLKFFQSRVNVSNEQTKLFRRQYYPTFTLWGIFQGRGSGFSSAYTVDQTAFTRNYGEGVNPTRANYLVGIGVNWNLTTILRNTQQVKSQRLITDALKEEYNLADQQLKAQLDLAELKIQNAVSNYYEVAVQVQAATDAYNQKLALYKNGLATLVELTQAIYALNRAETDRDVIYTNVWQALLLKAAASGDLTLFTSQL